MRIIDPWFLFRAFSSLGGSWNRVLFSLRTEFLGVFNDDTGVENITCALFASSLAGASSSDRDLVTEFNRNLKKILVIFWKFQNSEIQSILDANEIPDFKNTFQW